MVTAVFSATAVSTYEHLGFKWLNLPWIVVATIGTAVAFYVGFKNNSAYERTWEARKIWGAIVNSSRSWGLFVKDYVTNTFRDENLSEEELRKIHTELVYRHIAWLYKLRRQLWQHKPWEHMRPLNMKYKQMYGEAFADKTAEEEMEMFLDKKEVLELSKKKNAATQIIAKQSERLKELRDRNLIDDFRHMEMESLLVDFYTQQGKCERIKNFPLPRQYATSSLLFIVIFIFLMPFGLMSEFSKLGEHAVWLTVPFTMLVGWVYWIMEIVGDYAENPFEGLAFDIPMTALCRTIEIDLKEMLGEENLPGDIEPLDDVLL